MLPTFVSWPGKTTYVVVLMIQYVLADKRFPIVMCFDYVLPNHASATLNVSGIERNTVLITATGTSIEGRFLLQRKLPQILFQKSCYKNLPVCFSIVQYYKFEKKNGIQRSVLVFHRINKLATFL